jgi:hypothetical protein
MNKKICMFTFIVALSSIFVGCDWTSGGGVDSWNERWNWVNFSGTYRGISGGVLVTDFTGTPGTPGAQFDRSERVGTGNGSSTTFAGSLSKVPVIPGSLTISGDAFSLRDNGTGSLANERGSGSIEYSTGRWSISLQAAPDNGSAITASYSYTVEGSEGTGAPGPGSSGAAIRSFTVQQEGNRIVITDNNGAVYQGNLGSVRGSGGYNGVGERPVGETIIAQFSASGVSRAGREVKITGSLEGTIASGGGTQTTMINRRMVGTWVEAGGRTGDINGQTGPISLAPVQSAPDDAGSAN